MAIQDAKDRDMTISLFLRIRLMKDNEVMVDDRKDRSYQLSGKTVISFGKSEIKEHYKFDQIFPEQAT